MKCPFCAGEIEPDVQKCRHCGEWLNQTKPKESSSKQFVFLLAILIIGGFCALLIIGSPIKKQESAEYTPPDTSYTTQADVPEAPIETTDDSPAVEGVTMDQYSSLYTGMSYSDVINIIGGGEEVSRSEVMGHTTVMYSWRNPDGGNMNAMFQDRKMISKAQFGLK